MGHESNACSQFNQLLNELNDGCKLRMHFNTSVRSRQCSCAIFWNHWSQFLHTSVCRVQMAQLKMMEEVVFYGQRAMNGRTPPFSEFVAILFGGSWGRVRHPILSVFTRPGFENGSCVQSSFCATNGLVWWN